MLKAGLKKGDKVVVYGAFTENRPALTSPKARGGSDERASKYDKLQWSNEAVLDPALAVPVLIAYLESNPETKAIIVPGHGGITAVLAQS